jgi:hypothetical protein
LGLYEEKGEFAKISDLSTFVLDFLVIFFAAFAALFTDLVFLAIWCDPPIVIAA